MSKSPLNFGMFGAATIASGMASRKPRSLVDMIRQQRSIGQQPTMQDISDKLDDISSNMGSRSNSSIPSGPAAGDYSSTPVGGGYNAPGTNLQAQSDTLPDQNTTGVVQGGFSPRTAAVGSQMFGNPMVGSFDRQLESQQQIL